MNITEFRQKYPQYNDMDDDTLANTFYEKYYSDMPKQQFMLQFMQKPAVNAQELRGTPVYQGAPTGVEQLQDPSAPAKAIAETLPVIGAIGGGMLGAGSPIPGGSAIGTTLGYSGMKNLQRAILGEQVTPETVMQDVSEGMLAELGGKAIGGVAKGIGKTVGGVSKQFLGKTTGAGPGAVEEALKGGPAFKEAMRGRIPKEQVIGDALDALKQVKEQRGNVYREELAQLTKNKGEIDMSPIRKKLSDLLNQFNIKFTDDGLDFSRSKIDRSARKAVEEIVSDVTSWGSRPGDATAVNLDILKQRLDDFYTESSNASAFVSSLRNTVHKTITESVPKYAAMTGRYAASTKQIKELEKSLMLGKDKTADQILRRLTSSMRENFEMRREMVDILGAKAGKDLAGEIAGYSMSEALPKGLIGPLAIGGAGIASIINPKFIPLLATASPRTVGEFLRVFGAAAREAGGMGSVFSRGIAAYGTEKYMEGKEGK